MNVCHQIPYPLQVRQLVALQAAQLDPLVENWADEELLFEAIAKVDISRSTLESLHLGQEMELTSLLKRHSSSKSVSHRVQWNS